MNGLGNSAVDIERLVRLVMADLGLAEAGEPAVSVPSSAPAGSPAPKPEEEPDTSVLRLTSHVITLEQVRQGASGRGLRRLVVPKGAVVTPSVRDEVRKQGWELAFDGAASEPKPQSSGSRSGLYSLSASNIAEAIVTQSAFTRAPFAAGLSAPKGVNPVGGLVMAFHALSPETIPASFVELLRKTAPVELYQNRCVIETAQYLADTLAEPAKKGVLLTKYAAAASAVCNRHAALRALVGADPAKLESDAAQIGANLLILDPGAGFFRVRQFISRFAALGASECPSILRKGLE